VRLRTVLDPKADEIGLRIWEWSEK